MTVFVLIGSILLKILTVLLIAGLVLLVGFLVLPVVYRVKIIKNGSFSAKVRVRWFFGFFIFSFDFKDKKAVWEIRILGIPLRKLIDKLRAKSKEKKKHKKKEGQAKKQPSVPSRRVTEDYEWEKGVENEFFEEKAEENKISSFIDSLTALPEKIRLTIKKICDKLDIAKRGAALFKELKPLIDKIARHALPRKIKGFVEFGLDNPASTGMLTGAAGAFIGFIPETLEIVPNFTEKKLECDVRITGRIFLVYMIVYAVKIISNKSTQKFIKSLK